MSKCSVLAVSLIALFAVILQPSAAADDWFSLMGANYAAIQSGLAQLNNASAALNQSMNQQQRVIQEAFNGMVRHLNQSLVAVRVRYPGLTLTMSNQLSPAAFATYLNNNLNQFRQTVTDGVMIPAQAIVNAVLETMYNSYGRTQSNCYNGCSECVRQSAAGLIQPRISVGRLAGCILEDVPFFARIVRLVNKVMDSINWMVDAGLAQQDYCAADGSGSCSSALFEGLENEMNALLGSLGNFQSITSYYSNPGRVINKACAEVVAADIQDGIQKVKDQVAACG